MMRVVQISSPQHGRRVGVVRHDEAIDVTTVRSDWRRVIDVVESVDGGGGAWRAALQEAADSPAAAHLDYPPLLAATPGGAEPHLLAPLDHESPHRLLITGTGLTHLGSMQSRNDMHAEDGAKSSDEPITDSRRMFEMGLAGGKPPQGERGAMPEWFYKGNGCNLRGPNDYLDVPALAPDGGEEAELVGCYTINSRGEPVRLGFALGNEWSDHQTERVNYLYLAPSKLRTCAVGPELVVGCDFQEIGVRCRVARGGETLYDSGPLFTGEQHMCHSLANCEDHHFKYPQHRQPGDAHVHFFGTSKLSFGERDWRYEDGDEIRIDAPGFSSPLVNWVRRESPDATPVRVIE